MLIRAFNVFYFYLAKVKISSVLNKHFPTLSVTVLTVKVDLFSDLSSKRINNRSDIRNNITHNTSVRTQLCNRKNLLLKTIDYYCLKALTYIKIDNTS